MAHPATPAPANPLALLGRLAIGIANDIGALTLFLVQTLKSCARFSFYGQYTRQSVFVGFDSLPIVLLTAFFTGGVLALQSYTGLNGGSLANSQLGRLVSLSIVRELGPVLAALMLASRAGAAMAAELGSMRVSEQIDALQTLATNPMRYLVAPRVLACATMLPLLVILANLVGIFGGYMVSVNSLGISSAMYLDGAFDVLSSDDLYMSLVKAVSFGLLVGLMATYHGFNAKGGAAGVGTATTRAVVYASVAILVADYFITAMFV